MNYFKRFLILVLSISSVLTLSGAVYAAPPADGKYTIDVSFVEKSSRVYVESPTELTVKNGKLTSRITLKRYNEAEITKYSSLTMNGVAYMNSGGPDENSSFENIPVSGFDTDINFEAFSDAMGQNIAYKLIFDSSSLKLIELDEEMITKEETAPSNQDKEVIKNELKNSNSEKVDDMKETQASDSKKEETTKESADINSKKETVKNETAKNEIVKNESKEPISNKQVDDKEKDDAVSKDTNSSKEDEDKSLNQPISDEKDQQESENSVNDKNTDQETSDETNTVDITSNDSVSCEHLYVDGRCEKCGIEESNDQVKNDGARENENLISSSEVTSKEVEKGGKGTIFAVIVISIIVIIFAILVVKFKMNKKGSR